MSKRQLKGQARPPEPLAVTRAAELDRHTATEEQMNEEQRAAFLISQSAAAMIEALGMVAANQERTANGYTIAHDEAAFQNVIARHGIGHNDALNGLHGQ